MNGRVVNLVSNDVEKIFGLIENNADLYKGPVETIVFSIFIYRSMGISGLGGILLILSSIPFQIRFSEKMAKYSESIAKTKDKRLQFMSELLNGIQIVKMYGWEKSFIKIMRKIRDKEMEGLELSWFTYTILMVLDVMSKLALFLSLAVFVLAGNNLTSDKVFMLTIYYNYINISMVQYWSIAMKAAHEGRLAIKRIEEFLLENNSDVERKQVSKTSVGSIELFMATGSWTTDVGKKCVGIEEVCWKVEPATMNVLIGAVGCGKSSLLQAIAGELDLEQGKIEISGEFSYAAQEPWLLNESIKSNIVFNEVFDEDRYRKVIEACALMQDFSTLANGDETVIGERGMSLSGGQKARINLARAVYKSADIYLFDDVLSAVDNQVGSHIFNECFQKFLKGKTIILITHQLQYLSGTENVILMNKGRIESQGDATENTKSFSRIFSNIEVKQNIHTESTFEDEVDESEDIPDQTLTQNGREYLRAIGSFEFLSLVAVILVSTKVFNIGIDKLLLNWTFWEESQTTNQSNQTNTRINYMLVYFILYLFLAFATFKSYGMIFSSCIR